MDFVFDSRGKFVLWILINEGMGLSGIVSLMFCGIAMTRYALPNLSENGNKV